MTADKRVTESVWDYPRPPRIEADNRLIVVEYRGARLAEATESVRVLETSHPPVFYMPPDSVDMNLLTRSHRHSFCEYKGTAEYWDLKPPDVLKQVAWSYPEPSPEFESIRDWIAFYPSRVTCLVDGARVESQAGGFYGGWITPEIQGPFKGGSGTWGW